MMDWTIQNKVSEEVIHSVDKHILLKSEDIDYLIRLADENKRKRIRFCSHKNPNDIIQEMYIVQKQGEYIRPHKHIDKIESMLVIKGEVDYVIFRDNGSIEQVVPLGDLDSGRHFYNSMREPKYHMNIVRSEWLVFLEITKGPFSKNNSVFADFSPAEEDIQKVTGFMNKCEREIKDGILYS